MGMQVVLHWERGCGKCRLSMTGKHRCSHLLLKPLFPKLWNICFAESIYSLEQIFRGLGKGLKCERTLLCLWSLAYRSMKVFINIACAHLIKGQVPFTLLSLLPLFWGDYIFWLWFWCITFTRSSLKQSSMQGPQNIQAANCQTLWHTWRLLQDLVWSRWEY